MTATAFEALLDSATAGSGSKDEQMRALAANLQKRFAHESQEVKEGKVHLVRRDHSELSS